MALDEGTADGDHDEHAHHAKVVDRGVRTGIPKKQVPSSHAVVDDGNTERNKDDKKDSTHDDKSYANTEEEKQEVIEPLPPTPPESSTSCETTNIEIDDTTNNEIDDTNTNNEIDDTTNNGKNGTTQPTPTPRRKKGSPPEIEDSSNATARWKPPKKSRQRKRGSTTRPTSRDQTTNVVPRQHRPERIRTKGEATEQQRPWQEIQDEEDGEEVRRSGRRGQRAGDYCASGWREANQEAEEEKQGRTYKQRVLGIVESTQGRSRHHRAPHQKRGGGRGRETVAASSDDTRRVRHGQRIGRR